MATVTKYPQSSGTGWTNPTYAYSDDGTNYATLAFPKSSYTYNYYYNFNFGIPANATITQVLIESEYKVSTTASTATYVMACTKGTTVRGTEYSDTAEPTSDTQRTTTNCGTWTVAELNDNTTANGFNIRIGGTRGSSNTAVTGSVDYVRATITFSENYVGVLSISNASTVSATGKIGAKGVIGISSAGTPSAVAKKGTTGIWGMSAGNAVSVTGTKYEITNDYVGVLSISDGSVVTTSGKSGTYSVLSIGQGSSVTEVGKKSTSGVLGISASSAVTETGAKSTSGILSTSNSSEVQSTGGKQVYGVLEIGASGAVSVTGTAAQEDPNKVGVISISASSTPTSAGVKSVLGILEIVAAGLIDFIGIYGTDETIATIDSGSVEFDITVSSNHALFSPNQASVSLSIPDSKTVAYNIATKGTEEYDLN